MHRFCVYGSLQNFRTKSRLRPDFLKDVALINNVVCFPFSATQKKLQPCFRRAVAIINVS